MNSKEIWNIIVTSVQNNIYKKEELIQAIWNSAIFPLILGGSDCKNVEQEVPEGSTKKMDIVIKQNENTVAVVELKQHTHSRNAKAGLVTPQEQLFSYLNQLKRVNIGILVCDKLYIYNYDFTKSNEENATNCLEIPFEKDNELGAKFVELFSKENFREETIKEFISEKNRSAQNVKKLREEISNSKELIIKFLENEFVPKYGKAEFDEVINEFEIQIVKKNSVTGFSSQTYRTTSQASFAGNGENAGSDKLKKYIRTVGMSTFVKYYEQFVNQNFDTRDVKQVMRHNNEPWGDNSYDTKASAGKWIIKNGYGKEALQIIANANNTDIETIQKARELLLCHDCQE